MNLSPIALSLMVSLSATVMAFCLGTLIAWRLSASRSGILKGIGESILSLPMVLPPTVIGYYLLLLLGRGTPFGAWLNDKAGIHLLFTWQGAAIAASVMATPLFVRTAQSAFESVDRSLLEVGQVMGASEWTLLRCVTVPLSIRGIVAATILAFARALGEFGATLMIAGSIPGRTQTMPLALYAAMISGHDGEALALSLVLTFGALLAILTLNWLQTRKLRYRGEA